MICLSFFVFRFLKVCKERLKVYLIKCNSKGNYLYNSVFDYLPTEATHFYFLLPTFHFLHKIQLTGGICLTKLVFRQLNGLWLSRGTIPSHEWWHQRPDKDHEWLEMALSKRQRSLNFLNKPVEVNNDLFLKFVNSF